MERMAVYVVRILGRFLDAMLDMVIYFGLLLLSTVYATIIITEIPPISEFISAFDSIVIIFIIFTFISLIFVICCSVYTYIKFIKYSRQMILRVVLVFLIVVAALYVLNRLDGYELVGYSLSELFESTRFALIILWPALLIFLTLISFHRIGGHKINTHFKSACYEIKRLEKIQNNETQVYKDMYTVHSFSVEYARGIKEIKNLLIRGIDPNRFFDPNTEFSLNENLDWLVFSMQYYLFYGGYEQLEAAKEHLKCIAINFDKEYNINTDQCIHEILRMHNEIDIYFKKNNIYIARSIKFTDRVMGYFPQVLLAIILLVISILIKNYTLN